MHCNVLDDDEFAAIARSGGKVSISAETELNMGMGKPVFEQCRRHGLASTLSADVISLNSGDLWHELRFGLGSTRSAATEATNRAGAMPERVTTTAKEALEWVTVNAADALGLGDRIGSITPGKRADLQMVGGRAVEQHPRIDPYSTLAFQTTAADVRTVLVDGRFVKREGLLTGIDLPALVTKADSAAERILSRVRDAGHVLPGTPPGPSRRWSRSPAPTATTLSVWWATEPDRPRHPAPTAPTRSRDGIAKAGRRLGRWTSRSGRPARDGRDHRTSTAQYSSSR
ncbi:amidohydrolase family protein [Pseudonocardia alni]|uniref:amidohydrolase family protein n=1 Tax=Pseudonocardia alni TaxID=33907 RepID=UPI0037C93AD6